MRAVGYLTKRPDGLYGERGNFYDYIVAGNGVWVEAEGPLLAARVPVAFGDIRGLAPCEAQIVLRHGLIPQRLFDLALSIMMTDVTRERYVGASWDDGYHIYWPEQDGSDDGVNYNVGDNIVLDLHSHPNMSARFSLTDNKDEQGLRIYSIVGQLDGRSEVRLRVGVYGYFHPISWGEVFEGSLIGADDCLTKDFKDDEEIELESTGIGRFFRRFRRL